DAELLGEVAPDDVARFLLRERMVLHPEEPVEALDPHLELEEEIRLLVTPEHLEPPVDRRPVVLGDAIKGLPSAGESALRLHIHPGADLWSGGRTNCTIQQSGGCALRAVAADRVG